MALSPGDRLGPYNIDALLGAGGMGEVYRGRDERLGRHVALKVIAQARVGDADSRRRFEVEARAASALNHPAIVTIYDIGESAGMSWIAMEWIDGRTLRAALASGPLQVRAVWSIARQLADGLAAAHAKGIVHRDLKPENVMLTPDGRAKILDFGLARQTVVEWPDDVSADATMPGSQGGTFAGTILGTVGYMSPEQATGHHIDFRSDQFSLGVLLYELLVGRPPFAHPSGAETLAAIIRDHPPSVAALRGEVSDAFAGVIQRCLTKEPDERFATTRELAAALEALNPESASAAGFGGASVPPTAVATPPRRRLSQGLVIAALVTGVLAGAASLAFVAWDHFAADPVTAITSVAVLPFMNAADDADATYLSNGLTESLIDHLARASSLKVMARGTVMRFQGATDPQRVGRTLGVGAVVTGNVDRRGNQVVISAELIDTATGERLWGQTYDRPFADLLRVQDTIVAAIIDGLRLRLSGADKERLGGGYGTENLEAYELFLKGQDLMSHDTEEDDLEAKRLFEHAVKIDPRFVEAHLAISSIYARAAGNGYASPRESLAHARAAIEAARALAPTHFGVRAALVSNRFQQTLDWDTAGRDYRALASNPEILRQSHFHPVALFLVAIGRADEAATLTQRALAVDPGNLESRTMLGNFLVQAGRLGEALKVYEAISQADAADPRPWFGIAAVHRQRGEIAKAVAARRKAHELAGDNEGAELFAKAASERDYQAAEVTLARGQLRELRELAKQRYVSPFDIARLHALAGEREEAFAALEPALQDPPVGVALLKVDQAWNSIRADPRFAAIVRRLAIP